MLTLLVLRSYPLGPPVFSCGWGAGLQQADSIPFQPLLPEGSLWHLRRFLSGKLAQAGRVGVLTPGAQMLAQGPLHTLSSLQRTLLTFLLVIFVPALPQIPAWWQFLLTSFQCSQSGSRPYSAPHRGTWD